jgi:DNA (cytosine-5)-methyltransferase 1
MPAEIVVDLFAGGGGASTGIAQATGRDPDVAINHWAAALAMHRANHPGTRHYCESVFKVSPRDASGGRPVGLLWLSPDCTHHSKAKNGKPLKKKIRGLAWVACAWAHDVRPRVIVLENVEEFASACRRRRGQTFRAFVRRLERYGYTVEWMNLVAADYGAPTTRRRLFMIARRDGDATLWPTPTHGSGCALPWRTAGEIIDWSLPCPSIFERHRPLAEATLRRIAAGVQRYVVGAAEPFIARHFGASVGQSIARPAPTVTAGGQGHSSLVVPTLIQTGYGERAGQAPRVPGLGKPLGTAVSGQKHALVAALITKHFGSPPDRLRAIGSSLAEPAPTVTARDHNALTAAFLTKFYGTCEHGADLREPMPTVTAGGWHLAEVRALLERFAPKQLTFGDGAALVRVGCEMYAIADLGMRMLQPPELFAAQGFPDEYEIRPEVDGRPLTKTEQIALVGNSVCPPVAEAIVRANYADERREAAA